MRQKARSGYATAGPKDQMQDGVMQAGYSCRCRQQRAGLVTGPDLNTVAGGIAQEKARQALGMALFLDDKAGQLRGAFGRCEVLC